MNDVTRRFIETYKEMGLTGYRMGKYCSSITKQKISNIENGITEASLDMVSNFCEAYPQVNANYILTGKGDMFLKENQEGEVKEIKASHIKVMYENIIKDKEEQIEALKKEINRLTRENDRLTGENSIMREQIGIGGRKSSSKSA